jgi:hypothetical protein
MRAPQPEPCICLLITYLLITKLLITYLLITKLLITYLLITKLLIIQLAHRLKPAPQRKTTSP